MPLKNKFPMRTILLCCLSALCLFGPLQSTSTAQRLPSAPATSPLAPTDTDTSLLWRISAPGVAAPSYLYGTIHLIPEEDYFLPNTVVAALNDSEEVVFEIDPRDMQNPAKIMGLLNKINMRGDTSLEDLLPRAQYDSVEAYFSESGLPFFFFKKMKPLFLSAMVGQDMQAMGQGGGMDAGGMKSYEMELTEIAQAADKRISGLETMEFQLSLFDSIPYSAQALMLFEAVKADLGGATAGGVNQLDQMVDMYKRKAVAEMASSISDEAAGVARFEELLLTKRNMNWIPMIRQAMEAKDGGPLLFAVGAGHLGGKQGVIALLRSAGFIVEPVY